MGGAGQPARPDQLLFKLVVQRDLVLHVGGVDVVDQADHIVIKHTEPARNDQLSRGERSVAEP